jgi:hypothetical protein
MKRFLKISFAVVVCLAALVAVAITFTVGWRPIIGPRARPLTSRVFERTPERWARGKYIVEHLAACADCHSPHDWSKRDAPILPGMEGAGQNMSGLKGLPGFVVAPNLTPDPETGSGTWSDDALARAIREGIGHDGRALFNIMPYENYRRIPDEDLASIGPKFLAENGHHFSGEIPDPERASPGHRSCGRTCPHRRRGARRISGHDGRLQGLPYPDERQRRVSSEHGIVRRPDI